MNKKLPYILTTLIGFAVGILAGVWITRTSPSIAHPPGSVLEEVRNAPIGSSAAAPGPASATPYAQDAYLKLRAQMDDFRRKVNAIKASLRDQMDPLLTQQQRELVERWHERPLPPPPRDPNSPAARHFYEGFDSVITIIMVPFSLERLDNHLHFTPEQKTAVRKLLLERRAKFLDLVDTTPPPSLDLIKLAPPEARFPAQEK